ncbi:polynucleotide kinase [uncultured phage cr151_1]|jgi:tRNA uridine 5-carbamoylmethylation protein Kti12|uniref:Polynucleotide kinase n=1 Tax=uncultured phage cr151_1 TaxID=2986406 RepID=A0AAE7V425_9CAUD|nr:polynucleotide kinase [uncultured phage cr151_1]QWM89381.1 polynucleotide kinase [uncultured phage cr151_1]
MQAMSKIILCRGIQGSGKTTWAKQWVLEDPEHRVRFNNDDIRNMLGKYWVPSREHLVSDIKKDFIVSAMEFGYDIVVDNMNFNPKEIEYYENLVDSTLGYMNCYSLEYKDFFIPLEVCIERDSKRENPIGEEVIRKTYERYKSIIENV